MAIEYLDNQPSSKFEYIEEKPSILQAAGNEFKGISRLPEVIKGLATTSPLDIAKEIGREAESGELQLPHISDLVSGAVQPYIHPIKSFQERPITTALAYTPLLGIKSLLGGVGKTVAKSGAETIAGPTLDTSKVLAKMAGVQHSTVEGLANPELRKWFTPDLALKAENIEGDVLKSIKELPKGLSKAESKIYQNLGVTNETPTIWNNPIPIEGGAITPIEQMRNSINKFKEMATTDEMPIANKADEIVNKIIKDSSFDENKNMILPFGKAKAYSSKLYDLAQSDNPLEAKLYNEMYQSAKVAKNSMPEVAKAGNAFKNIEEARDLMRNSFRGFGIEGREFRVEKNIFSRYKDEGNVGFKQNMDRVGEILNQYPETRELADFSKKVKLMNAAVDFSKAKLPSGMFGHGAIQGMINKVKPSPSTIMTIGKSLADRGLINTKALTGTIPESTLPIIGSPINKYRAIKSILSKGE